MNLNKIDFWHFALNYLYGLNKQVVTRELVSFSGAGKQMLRHKLIPYFSGLCVKSS